MSTADSPGPFTHSLAPLTNWYDDDPRGHVVQFYQEEAALIDGLSRFVGAALQAGGAAIVIAKKCNSEALSRHLERTERNTTTVRERGRLILRDAAETLALISPGRLPDRGRFVEIIGSLIDQAKASVGGESPRLAIFGEMVGFLAERREFEAALHLENLWNELGQTHAFSLRCGYAMETLSRGEDSGAFLRVCEEHSGVIPSESYTALITENQRLCTIAELQQKAQVLDTQRALRQVRKNSGCSSRLCRTTRSSCSTRLVT
jgi:hypothetical protein